MVIWPIKEWLLIKEWVYVWINTVDKRELVRIPSKLIFFFLLTNVPASYQKSPNSDSLRISCCKAELLYTYSIHVKKILAFFAKNLKSNEKFLSFM